MNKEVQYNNYNRTYMYIQCILLKKNYPLIKIIIFIKYGNMYTILQ